MSKDSRDLLSNEAKETSNLQQSEESGKNYGSSSNSNSNLKVQHLKEKEENTNNDGHKNQLFQKGIPWEIYVSRALSAWGDRIWDFSLGIFMNLISPESLRLVAIQGFIVNISVIIFGSFIGNWIDRNPRLLAAKIFLSIQNIAVAIACAVLVIHFTILSEKDIPRWVVPLIVILIANIGNLASVGQKIVVEKDWIVVVAGDNENRLATMNAVFRTIDLTALVLSPSFAGLLFDFASPEVTAAVVGIWNLVSVGVEYTMLILIYKKFPELAHDKKIDKSMHYTEGDYGNNSCSRWIGSTIHSTKIAAHGWKLYITHPVFTAGVALATVYMTVLGFGNITYGFCMAQCVSESLLGALVGVSAVVGICGSLTFPLLRKKLGVNKTGLVGFLSLTVMLTLCVVSIWLEGSPFDPFYFQNKDAQVHISVSLNSTSSTSDFVSTETSFASQSEINSLDDSACYVSSSLSVSVLLCGIILGRFGLWVADLTVTQILQENVEEEHRGVINGVQNSANSIMNTIKFALVIGLPDIETFGYLIMASYAAVACGLVSFMIYALKNKNTNSWSGYKAT